MTEYREACLRLVIGLMMLAILADGGSALAVTRRRDYTVGHDFVLTPGGDVVPVVRAKYYTHAYVRERRPDCQEDMVLPTQGADWLPYGRDNLRSRARVRHRGLSGSAVEAAVGIVAVPTGGIGPVTFTAEAGATGDTKVCTSSAQANSMIKVNRFGPGTPVSGTIRSFGFAEAVRPPARLATAYAFSMTAVEARGGRLLRTGRIKWRRVVRDTVSGHARAVVGRRQRDPINFHVKDLVTNVEVEGTVLTVDLDIGMGERQDVGGFTWEGDVINIALDTDVLFVIDHDNAFNNSPGFLKLEVKQGRVTTSMATGHYKSVAIPAVGTRLPITFSLPNDIEFDYDLGAFDGHDLDVTFDFAGNGEVETELGADVPATSEWGLIAMALLLLTVGAVVIVRRTRRIAA